MLNHGAVVNEIYDYYKIKKPDTIIDFSTNTNVVKLNPDFETQIMKEITKGLSLEELNRYPDSDALELVNRISEFEKVEPSMVLPLNGSNQGIYLLAALLAWKNVAILEPTYPEYEKALKAYGCQVYYVHELKEINWEELDGLFICNPNNPTGEYIKEPEIDDLMKKAVEYKVLLVIDEAYTDFLWQGGKEFEEESSSLERTIDECDGKVNYINKWSDSAYIVLLKSMTKIFMLAGVRAGYLIASKELVENLKMYQPSWSINCFSQKLAVSCLDYKRELVRETKMYYSGETPRVISELRDLGLEVKDTCVNFYLVKTDADDGLITFLLKEGIIVRHTKNHVGLNGDYLRIAVKSRRENEVLIQGLKKWMNLRGQGKIT